MNATQLMLVLGGLVLAGCGEADGGGKEGAGRPPEGMEGMHTDSGSGGHMGMESTGMMPLMRAHIDSMARLSPQQMSQMMAMHEGRMAEMMDRMGADMRGMNLGDNADWNALTDSVRRDLADLSGLEGKELSQRMAAHAARVRKLIESHEGMMKGM